MRRCVPAAVFGDTDRDSRHRVGSDCAREGWALRARAGSFATAPVEQGVLIYSLCRYKKGPLRGPFFGGEGGIRTPGPREGTTHFECAPFDHSGTSPFIRLFCPHGRDRFAAFGGSPVKRALAHSVRCASSRPAMPASARTPGPREGTTHLTRCIPAARPAGALRASKTAVLPFCRVRPVRRFGTTLAISICLTLPTPNVVCQRLKTESALKVSSHQPTFYGSGTVGELLRHLSDRGPGILHAVCVCASSELATKSFPHAQAIACRETGHKSLMQQGTAGPATMSHLLA